MKKLKFIISSLVFWSLPAFAEDGDYITLSDGVPRYYEIFEPTVATQPQSQATQAAPAIQKKPTIVLVNGLVYDLKRWETLRKDLNSKGYRVFNYYMRGQFKTLRAEVETLKTPAFFKSGLTVQDLAAELQELRQNLFPEDQLVVVGLSYGSSVASEFAKSYPQNISDLFFLAPLVLPTDRYNPQGQWIFQSLEWIKLWWGPFLGPRFYDEAYNWIYRSYLGQRIVPERIPDEMKDLADQYKESIFHLVRATRNFDLRLVSYPGLEKNSVHYFLAQEEDQKVFADQVSAYDGTSPDQKGFFIFLEESGHAIPDSRPLQASRYLDFIIGKDSRLQPQQKYRANSEGLFLFDK